MQSVCLHNITLPAGPAVWWGWIYAGSYWSCEVHILIVPAHTGGTIVLQSVLVVFSLSPGFPSMHQWCTTLTYVHIQVHCVSVPWWHMRAIYHFWLHRRAIMYFPYPGTQLPAQSSHDNVMYIKVHRPGISNTTVLIDYRGCGLFRPRFWTLVPLWDAPVTNLCHGTTVQDYCHFKCRTCISWWA